MIRSRVLERSRQVAATRELQRSRDLYNPNPNISPTVVYLTLGENAPSEMFVTYHQSNNLSQQDVLYRKSGTGVWQNTSPSLVPFQNEPINIFHSKLSNLEGNTEYEFKIGYETDKLHKFITMPDALTAAVNIGFGSDFHIGYDTFNQNLSTVAANDCRIFIFGGDFVDDEGRLSNSGKWVEFWQNTASRLKDSKGRLIPLVTIIGNHEFAPFNEMENLFFHDMFPFPPKNPNYGVIDIGNYMSLFLMDFISTGGYVTQSDPKWKKTDFEVQYNWFQSELTARTDKEFIIPIYHPAFFTSDREVFRLQDRIAFKKLFTDHGIRVTLCGHDHVYKKTHELVWDEALDGDRVAALGEKGFIEIGDGGIGDKLYPGARVNEWYIDTYATQKPHVNIMTFEPNKISIQAKDVHGTVFDSTIINVN